MIMNDFEKINLLRKLIIEYNYHYYVLSEPLVSDEKYDILFLELKRLESLHPEYCDENSPTQKLIGNME